MLRAQALVAARARQQCRQLHLVGLDNLASPTGPIAESQNLAAQAFGADQTWYLVNGTTVGLQVLNLPPIYRNLPQTDRYSL